MITQKIGLILSFFLGAFLVFTASLKQMGGEGIEIMFADKI